MGEFNYEDVYELLRAEKYSTDLQPISIEQLQKIRRYLNNKEEFLVRQNESKFDDAIEKIKVEIDNAKRALRDLYDKRERKVISRAIFSARSGFKFKDTTSMLLSEEKLYFSLLELLKNSNEEFFTLLNSIPVSLEAGRASNTDTGQEPKTLKENFKRLKLIEAIPELMDTQLNRYGPFTSGMEIELPVELAELLLKQNKASEIQTAKV
jgi:DNA replication initiation complex subunit (GINS family)